MRDCLCFEKHLIQAFASARDVISGYTIFNDFLARGSQTTELGGQLGPIKGKDFDG